MTTWVENKKTKECWKLDNDNTKDVYQDDEGIHYKEDMWNYMFYPICPRENNIEVPESGEQMSIFDFNPKTCANCDSYNERWIGMDEEGNDIGSDTRHCFNSFKSGRFNTEPSDTCEFWEERKEE